LPLSVQQGGYEQHRVLPDREDGGVCDTDSHVKPL
jgi:hypothetical protein